MQKGNAQRPWKCLCVSLSGMHQGKIEVQKFEMSWNPQGPPSWILSWEFASAKMGEGKKMQTKQLRSRTFLDSLSNNSKMQTNRKTKSQHEVTSTDQPISFQHLAWIPWSLFSWVLTMNSQVYLTGFSLALAHQFSKLIAKSSMQWPCLYWHIVCWHYLNDLECSTTLMQGSPKFPACFECDGRLDEKINNQIWLYVCCVSIVFIQTIFNCLLLL